MQTLSYKCLEIYKYDLMFSVKTYKELLDYKCKSRCWKNSKVKNYFYKKYFLKKCQRGYCTNFCCAHIHNFQNLLLSWMNIN